MPTIKAEKQTELNLAYKPKAPDCLQNLDIPMRLLEDLVLRYLYIKGASRISELSNALKLTFPVIDAVFQQMRQQQLFEVTGLNGKDYAFTLSGIGREHALNRMQISNYIGPAPVNVENYFAAVRKQAASVEVDRSFIKKALSDLVLTNDFVDQLGPALISQNSIFLYGPTGNGRRVSSKDC